MTTRRRWRDRSRVHRWLSDLRTRLSLRPSTRKVWRARWSNPSFQMPWSDWAVPDAVSAAFASGWFKAGDAVLDVGCGDGAVAAFLARSGCSVTAIDFAEGAVARTEARCRPLGDRARAEVCDITVAPPAGRDFMAIVDVGCFQSLAPKHAARYARNVSVVCRPGARMLLVMPLIGAWSAPGESTDPAALMARIVRAFGPWFSAVDERETPMQPLAKGGPTRAGLAVRLERR